MLDEYLSYDLVAKEYSSHKSSFNRRKIILEIKINLDDKCNRSLILSNKGH